MYSHLILRELFEDLDSVVYRLMTDGEPDGRWTAKDYESWGKDKGEALGLALAIAKIHNLSEPNVDWVRAEAMRRWEEHLGSPTPISNREVRFVLRDCSVGDVDRRLRGYRDVVGAGRRSRVRSARVRLGVVRRVANGKGEQK